MFGLKYFGCGPRPETSEAALGPAGTSHLPWDKGKGLLETLSTGGWGFCGTAAAWGTEEASLGRALKDGTWSAAGRD